MKLIQFWFLATSIERKKKASEEASHNIDSENENKFHVVLSKRSKRLSRISHGSNSTTETWYKHTRGYYQIGTNPM